jgi:hypothetical protein
MTRLIYDGKGIVNHRPSTCGMSGYGDDFYQEFLRYRSGILTNDFSLTPSKFVRLQT